MSRAIPRLRRAFIGRRAVPLLALAAFTAGCDGGTDPGDTTPPTLISAATDGELLTLIFSEEVSAGSIGDDAFSLAPGTHDLEEATLVGTRQVTLEIEDRLPGAPPTTYTVTATNIADLEGNVAPSLTATFDFGREAPVIGAAYRLPDGDIVLINGDGTRFSIYSAPAGTFTPSQPVSELPHTDIPFAIGAAAIRHNQTLTYFWGTDRDSYIGLDHASGALSSAAPISFETGFPDCELGDGVGAAFVLGTLSTSPNRIYLFSADGTEYRIWSYAASGSPCGATASFPEEFGGGQAPIASVGAAFFLPVGTSGIYHLFDEAGTSYALYYGNTLFSQAESTADFGDGTLTFD